MTTATISSDSTSVLTTSLIELRMNFVESYTISPVMPLGMSAWMSGNALRTRPATSSTLASGATLMPMNTALRPPNAVVRL